MQILLGFDYGTVRTGVALAQDNEVEPLVTLQSSNLWQGVTELVAMHKPSKLVVGLPRNLDGETTSQTQLAKDFGSQLTTHTGLPVEYQDEAMSTERAKQAISPNATIAEQKQKLDQIAAAIILKDYLK